MIKRLIRRFLGSLAQKARVAFFSALSDVRVKGRPVLRQPALLKGKGDLIFDGKVTIGYYPSPLFYSTYAHIEARNSSASIRVGGGTAINNNFCAIAEHTTITIGRNCLIGVSVEIMDSDFHGLKVADRRMSMPEWGRPVVIEDDVFIGSNVKITKGVTIGRGAVVANGAVVVKSVPELVVVGGNPARIIKNLSSIV